MTDIALALGVMTLALALVYALVDEMILKFIFKYMFMIMTIVDMLTLNSLDPQNFFVSLFIALLGTTIVLLILDTYISVFNFLGRVLLGRELIKQPQDKRMI